MQAYTKNSGLEDLWSAAYAKNLIPKMMEGKSYFKCLRACFLTQAALSTVLFNGINTEQYNLLKNQSMIIVAAENMAEFVLQQSMKLNHQMFPRLLKHYIEIVTYFNLKLLLIETVNHYEHCKKYRKICILYVT